ncbi:MAG: ferredoxin--NADP reductase, partial [Pseudomonadota bacterium]
MAAFHPLEVTDIHRTIRDAVVLTLKPVNGGDFSFAPGQYLTFRQRIGGEDIRRSYSICAGLDDGVLQVGIKRVAGGAFSTFANSELSVGDQLEAMAPMGAFTVALRPKTQQHYLGFAGGSGITPVLSIVRTVLAREAESQFTLVYANRAMSTIMFRDEIEDLKNLYLGRLNVIHVLEDGSEDIELFSGRVTEEKCATLFSMWIDIGQIDTAFICGPEPMMLGIARALERAGLPKSQIKFELFSAAQQGRLATPIAVAEDAVPSAMRVTVDGATQTAEIAPGTSILDAAHAAGIDAPFACKAGVCSTCKARITTGEVEMRAN